MALSEVSEGLRENNISLQEIKEEIINLHGKLGSSKGGGGFNLPSLPKFLNPMKMVSSLTDSLLSPIRGVRNSMKNIGNSIKAPLIGMSKLFGNMFEMLKSPNFDSLIDRLVPALKPLFEPIYDLLKPSLDDLEATRERNRQASNNLENQREDSTAVARIPGVSGIGRLLKVILGLRFLTLLPVIGSVAIAGIASGLNMLFGVLGTLGSAFKLLLLPLRLMMGPLGIALLAALPLVIAFLNSETFVKLKDYVKDTMIPAIESFYNDTILPFAEMLEGSFFAAWKGISNFFSTEIGPAFDNISAKNGPLLTALADDLGGAFDALVSGDFATFGTKMSEVGTNSLKVIDNTATELFNAVARAFGFTEVDSLGFAISSFFGDIVASVVTFIDDTLQTLGFDSTAGEMIENFSNIISNTFSSIGDAFTMAAHLFTNFPDIVGATVEVIKASVSLQAIKLGNSLKNLFEMVSNMIADFTDSIKIAAFKFLTFTVPEIKIEIPGYGPVGIDGFTVGMDPMGAKASMIEHGKSNRKLIMSKNQAERNAELGEAQQRLMEAKGMLTQAITPPVIIQNDGNRTNVNNTSVSVTPVSPVDGTMVGVLE